LRKRFPSAIAVGAQFDCMLKNARVSISIAPLKTRPALNAANAPATTGVCGAWKCPRWKRMRTIGSASIDICARLRRIDVPGRRSTTPSVTGYEDEHVSHRISRPPAGFAARNPRSHCGQRTSPPVTSTAGTLSSDIRDLTPRPRRR